jgi:hypothetical protein
MNQTPRENKDVFHVYMSVNERSPRTCIYVSLICGMFFPSLCLTVCLWHLRTAVETKNAKSSFDAVCSWNYIISLCAELIVKYISQLDLQARPMCDSKIYNYSNYFSSIIHRGNKLWLIESNDGCHIFYRHALRSYEAYVVGIGLKDEIF